MAVVFTLHIHMVYLRAALSLKVALEGITPPRAVLSLKVAPRRYDTAEGRFNAYRRSGHWSRTPHSSRLCTRPRVPLGRRIYTGLRVPRVCTPVFLPIFSASRSATYTAQGCYGRNCRRRLGRTSSASVRLFAQPTFRRWVRGARACPKPSLRAARQWSPGAQCVLPDVQ